MNAIENLQWRQLLQECSNVERVKALGSGESCYCGFDPTAQSLQVGNLVPVLAMAQLAASGIKPIVLFGGATGAIGDPSGKSTERQLLSREAIETNISRQKTQFDAVFSRLGLSVQYVNNFDWTKGLNVLEFLRDVGKHFPVNYMLAKDSVKARLNGDGISYTEFSYMLLQAFDFLHLFKTAQCRLQVGGSDQWGNITAGLELIRRTVGGEAFALTFPLITGSDGKKLGKTEGGTIWLDPALTTPYKFFQYWLNTDDRDIVRYLKMLTLIEKKEIMDLEAEVSSRPESRAAQKRLANWMTEFVHGKEAAEAVNKSTSVLFGGSIDNLDDSSLEKIFADSPSSCITSENASSISVVELFVLTKLTGSKAEARRLISSGGAYMNNNRISDPNLLLRDSDALKHKNILLRSGKKNYHLVKIVN